MVRMAVPDCQKPRRCPPHLVFFFKKSLHREPPQPAGPPPLHVFFAGPLLCYSAAYTRGCCRSKIQDGAPVPQVGFTRPGAPSGISRAVRFWDASLQPPRPRAGAEAGGGRARRERDQGRSRSSSLSAPLASLSPALHAHQGALAAQTMLGHSCGDVTVVRTRPMDK
ncbi:hypothetical protein NDU88_002401 [Pleurodeles waltl]|uniref:Uncharacterized protein n=1 Tax=Pleurodeles waltl TaxID=8319 RepID=A0AAV7UAH1_PLEWA|nr:hypothetical protein NDU88_002401 [Pleurodeles waltl]